MAEPDVNHTKRIVTTHAGNGLAASQLIQPGSLIIKISEPHLILLEKAHLESTCSWCFQKPESNAMKRCGSCRFIRYCSSKCQKNDWGAIHKKECGILKNMPDVWPTPTRGLIHLFLRHKYGIDPDPRWEGLVMNKTRIVRDQQRFDQISLQALGTAKFSGKGQEWVEMGVNVLCQMTSNAFRVTLPDDTPIGLCFEPTLALANHSCSPNAVVVFDGRAISLRALTEIKQGEEIFISYIDSTQTRDKRRQELEYGYFFTCKCERCTNDEISYQTFLRLQPQIFKDRSRLIYQLIDPTVLVEQASKLSAQYLRQCNNSVLGKSLEVEIKAVQVTLDNIARNRGELEPQQQLKHLKEAYTGSLEFKDMHTKTICSLPALAPYPLILQNIYLAYLDTQSWIPALICLLSLALHTDPFTYPVPHHPVRVVRLYTIARLFKHISTLTPAEFLGAVGSENRDILRTFTDIGNRVEYEDILQVLMAIVSEEVGRSYGEGSWFAREVEVEVAELTEARKGNGGDSTAALGRWIVDRKDEEGARVVAVVSQVLWKLADCVGPLIGDAHV